MRVRLRDTTVYFDVDGAQLVPDGNRMAMRPTLLLLHGGPGFDHSHYKPAFTAFRDQAQLVFLDHRGQGRSDLSDASHWNIATWADDVADFCERLEIRKPILVGASFGGFVAIATMARHPALAGGTILLGTAAHLSLDRIVQRFSELGGKDAADAARALFANPEDPAIVQRYVERCFPLYARKGFDPLMIARSIMQPDVLAHFFRPGGEFGKFDYLAALGKVRVPTLMLHGELDPIVPVDLGRATAAAFPQGVVDLHVLRDCGHDIPQDAWDIAAPLIRQFTQKASAATG